MLFEPKAWARSVRAGVFCRSWPLDERIQKIAAASRSHGFLANPSGQYAYIYLTQLVKAVSERHFESPFQTLRVLDWGCGKGHVSKLIRDLGAKLESCDIRIGGSDSTFGQEVPIIEACNIAVKPLEHEYLLPYASDSFDVVLSFGVLEHVSNERASIVEISRVLRPGGLFFCFFLPTRLSWTQQVSRWRGDDYHDRRYTPSKVRDLLGAGGFDLIDIWYRQFLPKNSVRYPKFRVFEKLDLFITQNTPLRYFATNLEFISVKLPSRTGQVAPSQKVEHPSRSEGRV